MTKPIALDPTLFPLQGLRLIEASAGTGKTYTITALYLRLLLGHHPEGGLPPLGPEQILVVTFTEAATEELRDRIRARIGDARRAFLLRSSDDPLLADLLAAIPDHAEAAKRLEQASQQMDEAAIFTIHGFCQRMLKRHAFESGSLFETELTQDSKRLRDLVVTDFWRAEIYRMPANLAAEVLGHWDTPAKLASELQGFWSAPELRLEPDLSAIDLAKAVSDFQTLVAQFKADWLGTSDDDLVALIQGSGINKRSYTKANTPKWLQLVTEFCQGDSLKPAKKEREVIERFRQSTLDEKTTKGRAPTHPLFSQLEEMLDAEPPVKQVMLSRAYSEVARRFARHKQQHNLLTFDDLLANLDRALQAPGSDLLATAIWEQFPIALIDEFQDTDPMQFRIFDRIYGEVEQGGLVMIGDPKQAIYAFRGADIFTYIRARRKVDAPYTLDTNWRSTRDMVDAVNTLFSKAEQPFIYDDDIAFHCVQPSGKPDSKPLTLDGTQLSALTCWHHDDEDGISKEQYLKRFATATALEIERLLRGDGRIGERPLVAGDIAILVRDRFEADAIRLALARQARPCVYLSNRDSVFSTQEANDLLLILQAVEAPQTERFVRAALATALMGLDASALDRLNHDEKAWEAAVAEFSEYQSVWLRLGVLPMLRRLLARRKLAERLLSQADGERRLTDLLHLGELLQSASTEQESSAGLLRWYAEALAAPNGSAEEQQLRLESDRNLVTVVTIHKSKGLEYPVVFIPFPCTMRPSKQALYHEDGGDTVLDLNEASEAMRRAEEERLAEDLRLLYVAMTRSVYACYLGIATVKVDRSVKNMNKTALGYLLLQQERSLKEALAFMQRHSGAIRVCEPPAMVLLGPSGAVDEAIPTYNARSFGGRISRDWRLASYTGLVRSGGGHRLPERGSLDIEVAGEGGQTTDEQQDIFGFPRGARAGTFLHTLFENISFPTAGGEPLQALIREQLQLEGYPEHWDGVLQRLVTDVLDTPLNDDDVRLRALSDQDRQVEMEFMLPVQGLDCIELDRLTKAHDPLSARAGALSFERVTGMLKGFIDLVFRHNGRYYLLDYKSNHLGQAAECYSTDAMEQAMIEHRYDLQYQLYTLALHRLLKARLPGYDYEQHMGGVFYLFLRGIGEGRNGIFHCRPEAELVSGMDQLFREEA